MQEISQEIITDCQRGNTAAFARIIQFYERPLFAYIYRMQWSPAGREPEDIVQEVFMKAYENIHRFQHKDQASFSTWLFAITRNHCISILRKNRIRLVHADNESERIESMEDPGNTNPLHAATNKETTQRVLDNVARLPEPMRSALLLRYFEDMSYAQIAAITHCNETTARTRVARAKKILSQDLQDVRYAG